MVTEGWDGYAGLATLRYQHRTKVIRGSGKIASTLLPRVQRVASLLKRWLLGHIRAQIFLPEDPEPLLIDRATVKWVKSSEFVVDFDTLQPKVAEHITTVITTLVETQHGSFRKG